MWLKNMDGFESEHVRSCFETALMSAQREGHPSIDVLEAKMNAAENMEVDVFMAALQRRPHVYRYSWEQFHSMTPFGACDLPNHACDLAYLFPTPLDRPLLGLNVATRSAMIHSWLRFALEGKPGWTPNEVGVFDEGLRVESSVERFDAVKSGFG